MKTEMRRTSWVSMFAVAAFALGGCGGNGASNNATNATSDASANATSSTRSTLKVGLLTPGDINDQGWNQLAFEGLTKLKENGAETANQVTKNTADQQPALRDFGDKKFDLVFCHGYEYGERVLPLAAKYPGTDFVVVSGNVEQTPNVASLVPKLEEATYLLGMAAGALTKSNTVGLIGGMKLPVVASTFQAFELGAKVTNPKVKVLTAYVGNFEDQNAAKEATKQLIAQGADVFFHNADQAGKGMFNAAQEAKVLAFGSNRNQNDVAPDVCVASAVIEMPHAFAEVAKSVQDKTFKSGEIELNIPNDNIAVEWNDKLKSKIPAAAMAKIEAAQKQIKAGTLKIKRNV